MFGVNGGEILVLILVAILVLGPSRMPEYAGKLARGIRQVRVMAEGAKGQLKEQLGPEAADLNWRQYDPRQYDPRRIVRQALTEPLDEAMAPVREAAGSLTSAGAASAGAASVGAASVGAASAGAAASAHSSVQVDNVAPVDSRRYDKDRPTPWDSDAT